MGQGHMAHALGCKRLPCCDRRGSLSLKPCPLEFSLWWVSSKGQGGLPWLGLGFRDSAPVFLGSGPSAWKGFCCSGPCHAGPLLVWASSEGSRVSPVSRASVAGPAGEQGRAGVRWGCGQGPCPLSGAGARPLSVRADVAGAVREEAEGGGPLLTESRRRVKPQKPPHVQ